MGSVFYNCVCFSLSACWSNFVNGELCRQSYSYVLKSEASCKSVKMKPSTVLLFFPQYCVTGKGMRLQPSERAPWHGFFSSCRWRRLWHQLWCPLAADKFGWKWRAACERTARPGYVWPHSCWCWLQRCHPHECQVREWLCAHITGGDISVVFFDARFISERLKKGKVILESFLFFLHVCLTRTT